MAVRVRFAPSPTGFLHIGGARTALFNYLFARSEKGTFVLRVEDTDRERSTKEFEQSQLEDLKWLGLDYDEGPGIEGKYGPYRQSERLAIYKKYADQLIQKQKAFYCFCTDEELTAKKEKAREENSSPHYDGTCRDLALEEIKKRLESGEKATVRFKVPLKGYSFNDRVRGEVSFPKDMVGDFVIMRSNGLPVYNYCCVIDDWLMEITHVIRAEDHIPNTLRQLMLYEALGATPPQFAHASLLVGSDRQKLSKRHGATSVTHYREDHYLPEALTNYLCLLGWSHPEEKDVFSLDEIKNIFTLDRFTKASALYDLEKLAWMNGQHLKNISSEEIAKTLETIISDGNPYHKQSLEWKKSFVELFTEKVNFVKELTPFIDEIFDSSIKKDESLNEIYSWESTAKIKEYLQLKVDELIKTGATNASEEDFSGWSTHIKKEMKVKGKFLFMGMRGVLTGKAHGPDLKALIPLTPLDVIKKRME